MGPAISPVGVLTGQPADQCPDVAAGRWPAGPAACGPGGPAAADNVPVPAQDRVRGNQQPQPLAPCFGYHAEQGREQSPVRPGQLRAAWLPPLQDGDLVARWIKISAVFHLSSRPDSRSQEAARVVRRKTNRRHMTGDHQGRTSEKATLQVRAVDEILGTHNPGQEVPAARDMLRPRPHQPKPTSTPMRSRGRWCPQIRYSQQSLYSGLNAKTEPTIRTPSSGHRSSCPVILAGQRIMPAQRFLS
jgi:hypothetical protein